MAATTLVLLTSCAWLVPVRGFGGPTLAPFSLAEPGHFAGPHLRQVRRNAAAHAEATSSEGIESKSNLLEAFWKFLRPHTIRGTILGLVFLAVAAAEES
eukprot:symbB.v1.2.009001.t1/scaffold565.1/size187815/14